MSDIIDAPGYTGPDRRGPDRRDAHAVDPRGLIDSALRQALADVRLVDAEVHERHHTWIDAALQREAQRSALRRAIIEKTLAGLVWSALAWAAAYVAQHWRA